MKQKPAIDEPHPQVEIACPHCGGTSVWMLLQTLNQCSYCGSVLNWPYPEGEPDYLIAESTIKEDSDLIEVLAMYDAMREASRRRGALRAQGSDYEPDIYYDLGAGFTDTSVYEIKRERLHLFRLLKTVCVYVPFQLISSLLVFHVLGRNSNGSKIFRSLFFHSDAILPGYPSDWNFRDRGLHMSKQTLKPLSAGKWNKNDFLTTGSVTKEIEKVTRQWTGQRKILEAEIQPVCFQGSAVESHRWWVYRPYYFVHAGTPQGTSWFLVDGQFGTIAGTPTEQEVSKLIRGSWKKLNLHSVRAMDIRIVPFRCPNCGWDMQLHKGIYQVCDNCTRLAQVKGTGLQPISYTMLAPEQLPWWPKQHRGAKVWLPFWRVKPSMLLDKKVYNDLAVLAQDLIPAAKQPTASQKHLFIPAFDCLSVARYDAWAFQFGAALSACDVSQHEMTIHNVKSSSDFVLPVQVPLDSISSFFPQLVAMYFPPNVQARMSTMLMERLAGMHVLLKSQQLVYVPAALMESRGAEPRVHSPHQTVEWLPMKNSDWPPALQRTVRRWKAMAESQTRGASGKVPIQWVTSVFTKKL